jgi:hypothetical protein
MTALCFTFSLCFRSTQLSKKSITFPTCSKAPEGWRTHQFIQRVEQLNAYVAQLPCWYYSPSYNAGMTPVNVPFTKADVASHVLWMCPHQWQDQYNMQKRG